MEEAVIQSFRKQIETTSEEIAKITIQKYKGAQKNDFIDSELDAAIIYEIERYGGNAIRVYTDEEYAKTVNLQQEYYRWQPYGLSEAEIEEVINDIVSETNVLANSFYNPCNHRACMVVKIYKKEQTMIIFVAILIIVFFVVRAIYGVGRSQFKK